MNIEGGTGSANCGVGFVYVVTLISLKVLRSPTLFLAHDRHALPTQILSKSKSQRDCLAVILLSSAR